MSDMESSSVSYFTLSNYSSASNILNNVSYSRSIYQQNNFNVSAIRVNTYNRTLYYLFPLPHFLRRMGALQLIRNVLLSTGRE